MAAAEESLRTKSGDFYAFHDFVALNDVLNEDGRTIELVKWLDYDDRHLARSAFNVAILVNRDRPSEAEGIAERALQLLEDETHRIQISDALEGIPPERLR